MTNIFKTIKRLRNEKQEYRAYKKRAGALPNDYRIVLGEIEAFMWEYSLGASMMKVFYDILELFENGAGNNQDVLDVVGNDVGSFCEGILNEMRSETWTGKRREKLNHEINKKLGR